MLLPAMLLCQTLLCASAWHQTNCTLHVPWEGCPSGATPGVPSALPLPRAQVQRQPLCPISCALGEQGEMELFLADPF